MTDGRPLPDITDENRPFWDSCARHQLSLQRCRACARLRYPISPVCPRCLGTDADWVPVSGRGRVFAYVVFHQVYHPAFRDEVPYNVALVQLEEGPLMLSNVIGIPSAELRCDLPVGVVFERLTETVTLPRFRPLVSA